MRPTEMPAERLTADCIRSSFRSSNKRHIILTGKRRSGKTTLLSELFPKGLPGLTSLAEPEKAVYLRDNLSGQQVQAGIFDGSLPGTENKMVPVGDAFNGFGASALEKCAEGGGEWVSIDEIGYLEVQCGRYCEAIRRIFDKKRVAAVIRKQELPFLRELCSREDAFVVDLDRPFGNTGCVIMASGLGRRFGGNKLMADFHGEPVISRILDATEGIFSQRVVVTVHKDIAELCEDRGIQTVLHNLPYRSDTVRLGLEAVGDVERCMFTPSDQPLLRRETVEALVLLSENEPSAIWRTVCGNTVGAPVIFPKQCFGELLDLPEGKGGGAVSNRHPGLVRTLSVQDIGELTDIDTPEDLAELLKK